MTYSADPTDKRPTHHIVLTDGTDEVGILAIDAKVQPAPASIVRTPVERSSLKMSSGNQSHSDLKPPYAALDQSEWNGGRGGKTYEDDVTRFWSSCRADTGRSGKVILNAREWYGTGYRDAVDNMPGSLEMVKVEEEVLSSFSATLTMDHVLLFLARVGEPGNLIVTIYHGDAVVSRALAYTALREEIISEPYLVNLTNTSLNGDYTLGVSVTGTNDAENYWKIGMMNSGDGSSIAYRIMDDTPDMNGKFFIYENILHFITQPSSGSSELWVEADGVWSKPSIAVWGTHVTNPITDIAVMNKMVAMAFGAAQDMVAFRLNGSTYELIVDTGQKGTYLESWNVGDQIQLARVHGNAVSHCVEPTWGDQPTWSAAITLGMSWEPVTGLVRYADDNGAEAIVVMKETGPWLYDGDSVESMAREEIGSIRSPQVGKVAKKSDVYLWMSVGNDVWRYYPPTFDSIGFMTDDGLPADMQGVVSCIMPYPGRTLVSVDAGASGYSCILENNGGSAWHEKYRAPKGERIYQMEFLARDGECALWIRQGADFVCLPYPTEAFDPKQDATYPYQHEGVVELGEMYAGLQDAWKHWNTLKVWAEDLDADCWIEADYRLDDGAWMPLTDPYTEMPMQEQALGETDGEGRTFGVNSKKFQLRLRLYSTSALKSPTLRSITLETVTVVAPKFTYSCVAYVGRKDLNNDPDETLAPYEKMQKLDEWSGTAKPLWMRCVNPLFDNRPVFLVPLPGRPLTVSEREGEFEYTTTITLQEA